MLSWCGALGMTTEQAIIGAVGGDISMLHIVDSPDVNVVYICNDLRTVLLLILQ